MESNYENFIHETVLRQELVAALNLTERSVVVDCTLGGGGHSEEILRHLGEQGQLLALDRDMVAIEKTKQKFTGRKNFSVVHSSFAHIHSICDAKNLAGKLDAVCADIGVSSEQLDRPDRGFSFQSDGPLDMRMDRATGETAADIVNTWEQEDLANIIYKYGDEPKSRIIARKLVERRSKKAFATTLDLAQFLVDTSPYGKPSKKHPATKVFQALRIAVNDELGELETLLRDGFALLKSGGRMAVITFHSLEDRIVKHKFLEFSGKSDEQRVHRDIPLTAAQANVRAAANLIKPFPLVPSESEIARNPRARSAKLRVIEKI